jgi:thiamine pyrophosphate-dependent acetolactate synthase large subunit-like protein
MAANEELAAFPQPSPDGGERVADRIVTMAQRLGIEHAFGVIGGACAILADALGKSGLKVVQTRHEAGAAFSAAEASLLTGKPALVFTTTGPGLLNALNGLVAGRWDGARVLVVSAVTGPAHRRRLPVQETSAATMPMDAIAGTGPWFDFGVVLEDAVELAGIENTLSLGFSQAGGFVAHIAVPTSLHGKPAPLARGAPQIGVTRPRYATDIAGAVASILKDGPFAVWIGAGAIGSARLVRELVDRAGAPFIVSPRAKGTVSERHPLYLGVTGAGGHGDIDVELAELGITRTLVLGTRLGEATTFYRKSLVPPGGLLHIDIDRRVFGAAYPDVETVGIEAEIGPFLEELVTHIGHQHLPRPPRPPFPSERPESDIAGVHPRSVMHAIQRVVVDASDAIVLAESGNAFGWANHHLMFAQARRYRTSPAWGSMGHMVAGAIGAATASKKPVVVITGDGAMLMNNEINTAVQENLPIVWVVLNDAGYGIVRDGMRALGLVPFGCDFPETDFVGFARSQGALGRTVHDAIALDSALIEALQSKRPFVIDVKTARGQMSPAFMQRNASLTGQTGPGGTGPTGKKES